MKTKLNMHNTFIKLVFLGLICAPFLASGQEEEVILSSASMKEAEEWNTRLVVKPKYRYVDSLELRTMISLALQPNFMKFPGYEETVSIDKLPKTGVSAILFFEKFLADSGLTFFVENTLRLYESSPNYWDYRYKMRMAYEGSAEDVTVENRKANIYSLDIGLKYYFLLKKKSEYGASGINPFNEYAFVKLKDVVNYSSTYHLTYDPVQYKGYLLRREDSTEWVIMPSYIVFGIGVQRRFLGRGYLDFYVGGGINAFNNRAIRNYKDYMLEMGLNVGVWLGAKRWKK